MAENEFSDEDLFGSSEVTVGTEAPEFSDEDLFGGAEAPQVDTGGGFSDEELFPDSSQLEQDYQDIVTLGDRPKDDKPEAGFFSGLVGGVVDTLNTSVGVPAELINESIAGFAQENFPGTAFAEWTKEADVAQKARVLSRAKFSRSLPHTATLSKIGEAEDLDEVFSTIMDSNEKWATFKEFVGSVIPASAAFAGGAALQGLKGAFGTSMVLDWGNSYQESIAQGKTKDEALLDATTKSLVQSGIDILALSAGKLKLSTDMYKDMFAQTAIQMTGGAGAEYLKHAAVGEETTTGKMFLEGAGELVGAPVDVFAIRRFEKRQEIHDGKIAKLFEELTGVSNKISAKAKLEKAKGAAETALNELDKRAGEGAVDTEELPDVGADPEKLQSVATGPDLTESTSDFIDDFVEVYGKDGVVRVGELDWEIQKVHTAIDNHYSGVIETLKLEEGKIQGEIDAVVNEIDTQAFYQKEGMEDFDPEIVAQLKAQEDALIGKLLDAQQDTSTAALYKEKEAAYIEKAAGLIEEIAQEYAPEMRVLVSGSAVGQSVAGLTGDNTFNVKHEENSGTHGQHYTMQSGVQVIELDIENVTNLDGNINEAQFTEVVVHELAHSIINEMYNSTDIITQTALRNGYRKWLRKLVGSDKNLTEFMQRRVGAAQAAQVTGESFTVDNPAYTYNFDEYLANQLAKSIEGNALISKPVDKFFKRVLRTLRGLFTDNRHNLPESSFTDFMNAIAAKTTLTKIQAAIDSKNVDMQEKVLKEVRNSINAIFESSKLGKAGLVDLHVYGKENFNSDLDKYNWVIENGVTLLQLGKLNPHIDGLATYIREIKEWWNTKMSQTARADERLHQWNSLKPKDSQNLGRFMQELTVKSYDDGVRYDPESSVFKRLVEKHGMTNEMLALADLIEQDFNSVLDELEAVQREAADKLEDDLRKAQEHQELDKTFAELRNKNFFPLSRFGDWFTRIKAQKNMLYDGVEYKAGETITFETFESQKDMKKRQGLFKNKDKYLIEGGLMNDTQKQFAGFPPQFLNMLKDKLELTDVQRGELEDVIKDLTPGRSFTKHMKHRKNTPGFSTDAVRSYANYFLHFGNYVARIKHKGALQTAIEDVGDTAGIIGKRTGDGSKRTRIQGFMKDHFDNAMDPGNEWANLRAVGFIWHLGFVPKSAIVNLTQVPLVTYPYLAGRYGDSSAVTAITKATKDAGKYWMNPKAMSKGQMDMIYTLIQTGILDESMATELAAASEGSMLNRIMPGSFFGSEKAGRAVRQVAAAGAWMFQKAEKVNRWVTALAAYDLAKQNGATEVLATEAARDAVESSQFEYARWNRAKFMRGKKSIMFLFWQYMQNSLFFLAHDPGRMRYAAMMLLFAGLSGFPFAEDAMDLYDYITKKLNKKFGEDFADTNIRLEAQKFIKELGMNPDLVMHGASRYSFGMAAVGDMVGLPIPNADMSGSLSMGSIIPGWHAMLGDTRFDQGLGRGAEDLGGAVVAMPIQLMRAIADNNPDTLKRFERAMPSFAKHMSAAYRYADRGVETLPDGTVIANFNLDDSIHKAEIGMKALGFQVSKVSAAKVPVYMTKGILQYYALRRQSLLNTLDYAVRNKDGDMRRKVWGEIVKYNKSLKSKGLASMGIRTSSIRRGLKDRAKHRILQEKGYVGGKQGVQVSREVYDSFDLPEEVP